MKNCDGDEDVECCSSNIDSVAAAAVADVLGAEIERFSFSAVHKRRVQDELMPECSAVQTPNPDTFHRAEKLPAMSVA